jgi:hypothetical protein
MAEQSDFQKQFFAKGTGGTLFTQKEFDDALELAKTEIMAFAIDSVKQTVIMEREACAKIAHDMQKEEAKGDDAYISEIAKTILNRIPSQRQ